MAAKPKIPNCGELAKSNPQVDMEALGNFMNLVETLRKTGIKKREYDLVGPRESRLRAEPPTYATKIINKR